MRLTEEDARQQRTAIMFAAFDVFTTVGYSAARMEMISKKANISRSPLYYYYSNKLELFTQVCKAYFRFYLKKMDTLFTEKPGQTIYERYYQLFMESRIPQYVQGNDLSTQILQGGEELNELKVLQNEYWNSLREKDMAALKRAQARGEIRRDAELEVLLNYYYTVYHGLRARKLQEEFEDQHHLEEVCYTAVKMMENLYSPTEWERDKFRHIAS